MRISTASAAGRLSEGPGYMDMIFVTASGAAPASFPAGAALTESGLSPSRIAIMLAEDSVMANFAAAVGQLLWHPYDGAGSDGAGRSTGSILSHMTRARWPCHQRRRRATSSVAFS